MARNDIWDKLAASAPVNADAARALGRGGPSYEPAKKVTQNLWDAPPKMRKVKLWQGETDLAGTKFGRLTAIGPWADAPAARHALWVCRCSCGKYVSRSSKAIKNPANTSDRCDLCRHTAFLRDRHWSVTERT